MPQDASASCRDAAQFLTRLREGRAIAPNAEVAVVVAHFDDEVIGFGAQFRRFPGCLTVHVTDSAPMAPTQGPTRERNAVLRADEARRALALAGHEGARETLGVTDLTAAFHLADIARALERLFARDEIRFVLTHAYEGGHPDHDAVAFAVHAAKRLLSGQGQAVNVIEAPFYRMEDGRSLRQDFVPAESCETVVLSLDEDARALKRRLFAVYESQKDVLAGMSTEREWLRAAPAYDFARLPNGGRLHRLYGDAAIAPERWPALTAEALRTLGLDGGG
jgi:N-acetylglucosamine malate deacetylase 2